MSGEFNEIFNERGLVLGVLGALGAAVRTASLKTTWREGIRVIFIGAILAFGVGSIAPYLLRGWIGDLPEDLAQTLGVVGAAAFLTGLMGVTIIERLIDARSIKREGNDET